MVSPIRQANATHDAVNRWMEVFMRRISACFRCCGLAKADRSYQFCRFAKAASLPIFPPGRAGPGGTMCPLTQDPTTEAARPHHRLPQDPTMEAAGRITL